MEKLSKQSLNYYLSEYLEDLSRAGVRDYYRGPRARSDANAGNAANAPRNERQSSARPNAPAQPTALPPARREDSRQYARENAASAPIPPQDPNPLALAGQPRLLFTPSEPGGEREKLLTQIAQEVAACTACSELASGRTQVVFGSGNPYAELCFVGEGPGADEDRQGLPFVGRSGQLLTDMIEKGMGIPRSSVFICNVVRCRPPQNRNPLPAEAQACRRFLDATLEIVRPKFICCLGSIAATNLLQTDQTIGKLRGALHDYNGAKVVCTYHPAYLLRNPPAKKQTWEDLQLLMREMGLNPPGR